MWLGYFAGSTISQEAAQFPAIIERQINELFAWARTQGFAIEEARLQNYLGNIGSGISTVTRALGGILGGAAGSSSFSTSGRARQIMNQDTPRKKHKRSCTGGFFIRKHADNRKAQTRSNERPLDRTALRNLVGTPGKFSGHTRNA